MEKLTFDYRTAAPFLSERELSYMAGAVEEAHHRLHNRSGAGNDFLGWLEWPTHYDKEEFSRIKKAAAKIQADSDVLVVIGIGGSYLGARAAIEMLNHSFYNLLTKNERKNAANLLRRQFDQPDLHPGSVGCVEG